MLFELFTKLLNEIFLLQDRLPDAVEMSPVVSPVASPRSERDNVKISTLDDVASDPGVLVPFTIEQSGCERKIRL